MFLNALLFSAAVVTVSPKFPLVIEHEDLSIEFSPRTPEQMGSFYEARGFPREVREVLQQQCFITVKIRNHSQKKIWLDLAEWQFSVNGKVIQREHRDYWKQRWQAMNVPLRYQSTFRWTLIPESLDYLPGEEEGGNLVLPFTRGKMTLDAKFATGKDKDGEPIHIHFDQLYCAEDRK